MKNNKKHRKGCCCSHLLASFAFETHLKIKTRREANVKQQKKNVYGKISAEMCCALRQSWKYFFVRFAVDPVFNGTSVSGLKQICKIDETREGFSVHKSLKGIDTIIRRPRGWGNFLQANWKSWEIFKLILVSGWNCKVIEDLKTLSAMNYSYLGILGILWGWRWDGS